MANKFDFMSLVMKDGEKAWKSAGKKSPDLTEKRRNTVIDGLKRTIGQIDAKDENPKRGWYSTKADLAKVSVKAGNKFLPIAGSDFHYVPAERVKDFYTGVLAAVEGGDFDTSINAVYEGGMVASGPAKVKQTRKPRSAEAIEKARQTRAANKAAKEAKA